MFVFPDALRTGHDYINDVPDFKQYTIKTVGIRVFFYIYIFE